LSDDFVLSTFVARPLSYGSIDKATEDYLAQWMPEALAKAAPVNIETLVDRCLGRSHGFRLYLDEGLSSVHEGSTDFVRRRVRIRPGDWELAARGHGRERNTAAHEAAHVILHSEQVRQLLLRREFSAFRTSERGIPVYCRPEWQAAAGAVSLLIPRPALAILASAEEGFWNWDVDEEARLVSDVFAVSYTSTLNRLKKIKEMGLMRVS